MIYIIVEQEGSYSDKDWKILGVFTERKKAILFGLNYLIDIALRPYKIEFYKDREDEFTNCIGLPDIYIEYWNEDSNKNENIYLDFQNKPYQYNIDKY